MRVAVDHFFQDDEKAIDAAEPERGASAITTSGGSAFGSVRAFSWAARSSAGDRANGSGASSGTNSPASASG